MSQHKTYLLQSWSFNYSKSRHLIRTQRNFTKKQISKEGALSANNQGTKESLIINTSEFHKKGTRLGNLHNRKPKEKM